MTAACANARRGFTVLELLVALAVLLLASAAVTASLRPPGAGAALRTASAETMALLRAARGLAIVSNESATVVFDASARTIGHGGRTLTLPDAVSLAVTGADAERRSEYVIGIRFLPSGRATGGRITLAAGGRSEAIVVNWLTGEPRRAQEPER
jgi:general secretion pathway protein H